MEKANFKELTILQRMSEIENELPVVGKNIHLKAGNINYKAVSEVDVKNALKPLEYKWGVKSTPINSEVVETRELLREGFQGKQRIDLFVRLKITTRFACVDRPEEFIDVITYGDGIDPQDKAVGKASTYGLKYGLMNAYKMETGDDPDLVASQPQTVLKADPKQQAAKLYAHAINTTGTEENAQKALQAFLTDKYGISSLKDLTFEKATLKQTIEEFDTYQKEKEEEK